MRILWIDDEIDLLRPFIYDLKARGYEVDTATNGPDGLEKLRSQTKNFDLVLLDVFMTGMDGLMVLKKLKEFDPNILVAMITKAQEEVLVDEAYAKLADDFIVKPFTQLQILAVLKRLLAKKSLIKEQILQEYAQLPEPEEITTAANWLDHYLQLVRWQTLLFTYGDETIRESFEYRKETSNKNFSRYIESQYQNFLLGKGPILSHKFFESFVLNRLGKHPVYLIVFDSMRLDQWQIILPLLREHFEVETDYYFSILPTATAYSRNALFSGLLPLEIYKYYPNLWVFDDTGQNRYEEDLFLRMLNRFHFSGKMRFLKTARNEEIEENRNALLRSDIQFFVVIINFLDLLIHSVKTARLLEEIATNEESLLGLTRLWFSNSVVLNILSELSERDCEIIITSDHGFIKVSQPTIIYGSREISPNLRYKYGAAIRTDERYAIVLSKPEDFMLPAEHPGIKFAIAKSNAYFIYPTKPKEYGATYKYTYQHGGVSLEEMILPVGFLKPRR